MLVAGRHRDPDDELVAARRRFPLGDHVTGRIELIPRPGAIGVFIDLGGPPQGFADALNLPRSTADWPQVGTVTTFEVTQHRQGQVRLWPLDPRFHDPDRRLGRSEAEWTRAKDRYPVGAAVTAHVSAVYGNRKCSVTFADEQGLVEWSGPQPLVGATLDLEVARHLEAIRALLLMPRAAR